MPCSSTRCPGRPPYVLFPLTAGLPLMGSRSCCANSLSVLSSNTCLAVGSTCGQLVPVPLWRRGGGSPTNGMTPHPRASGTTVAVAGLRGRTERPSKSACPAAPVPMLQVSLGMGGIVLPTRCCGCGRTDADRAHKRSTSVNFIFSHNEIWVQEGGGGPGGAPPLLLRLSAVLIHPCPQLTPTLGGPPQKAAPECSKSERCSTDSTSDFICVPLRPRPRTTTPNQNRNPTQAPQTDPVGSSLVDIPHLRATWYEPVVMRRAQQLNRRERSRRLQTKASFIRGGEGLLAEGKSSLSERPFVGRTYRFLTNKTCSRPPP